ncbi:hypothetical protein JTE90_018022 [Oedothorax gibbosus]|uniref:Caprin-1 dimerization domain-containing protein n=1 Tax=Oedothorax gibbosus TaxID=931172 RepID=A0AAV6V9U6_9ARAC|nr:hypothetical protein JTE90_018022 [Oedothorax gibbosus]
MPSASAKLEKQMSTETYDPMKQIVTIVEKKVRNLEKRKGKLDSYRLDSQNGKELNEDQKKAVEKYDQVVELLDFAKDLQKQFSSVVQETSKEKKKAAKRDQLEQKQQELQRIKEIMVYQDLLNSMGGEDARQDFLDGNKGAVKLTEAELDSLDELYKAICPERDLEAETDFDSILSTSSEHIQALLDAKNKEAFGTTYKSLRETLQKINSCTYFSKPSEPTEEESSSLPEEQDEEQPLEPVACSEVDEYALPQKSEEYIAPQAEGSYYQVESPSMYAAEPATPQPPIQEVLSNTNLNFLQESQIEVAASHQEQAPSTLPGASYANMHYPAQPSIPSQHLARMTSEETMSNHSATPNLMANPAALQSTAKPADYDTGRPIPTQTYTNQSFHPMMVPPPQSYAPQHAMSPAHVLAPSMVVQPMAARSVVTSANAMAAHHAPQLNTESSQPAHVQNLPYESSEIQEIKHVGTYGNGGGNHAPDNRVRSGNNAYARNPAQVEYVNDRAPYQSTNNNQAYLPRDNFGDNSSYSSNLKRGLTSRGGPRGGAGALRGGNMPRGNRVGGNRY